jgi:hypothetical protein
MHSDLSFRRLVLVVAHAPVGLAPAVVGASGDVASAALWQDMVSQISESWIYDSIWVL